MATTTANLSLNKGAHGDWPDFWEIPINQNWDILDALFHDTTGHMHTGVAGDGPKVDHADLLNAGTLTHAQLDASSAKAKVSAADTTEDYLENKIQAGLNVTVTKQNAGANEYLEVASTGGGTWTDDDEYGDKHTPPTSAPVAYTDNFNWPMGFSLQNADYLVSSDPYPALFDFLSTGYSARIFLSPPAGDPMSGTWVGAVLCHIPHSPAQRATLSITDFTPPEHFGDSVCFTLALFSSHQVGPHLPQKYGVFLEIHATCVGTSPLAYQVSHRVVVIPDDTTRVEFPACVHSDIEDIKGCWEISLDQNGHVYVYWRRRFVYSTQTSPVSTPGPVAAYFATLKASLEAAGEPPYGAIGFGMRYVLGPDSTMDMEVRWFSMTATDDLYHETPSCAGTPLIGPFLPDFTEEFLTTPPGDGSAGTPGSQCCSSPDVRTVGDVLETDLDGNPLVWIVECGQYEGSVLPGYRTNVTHIFTPCEYMVAPSPVINITSGPDPWEEGAHGTAIVSGIQNLTPSMEVTPSIPEMRILNKEWLSYDKMLIEYEIDDGTAGLSPDLTVEDRFRPANSVVVSGSAIAEAGFAVLSLTWKSKYDGSPVAGPVEGATTLFEMVTKGSNSTVLVTSADPGVVVSATYINPSLIRGEVTVPLQTTPPVVTDVTLDVDNDGDTVSVTSVTNQPAPLLYFVDASSNAPSTAAVNVVIHGNFFRSDCQVTVAAGDFTITAVTWISPTQINVTGDTGLAPPDVVFTVSNGPGLDLSVPVLSIGAVAPAPPVIPLTPAPQEGTRSNVINVAGAMFFDSTYLWIATGLGTDPDAPYASPGNCHIVNRIVNAFDIVIEPVCGDGGNAVNAWLCNPGTPPVPLSPVFTVGSSIAPGALVCTPNDGRPGDVIVGMQITGTNINSHTTLSTPSAHLTLTNIVAGLGVVTFDLAIAAGAPPLSSQDISVDNPCGQSTTTSVSILSPAPVITDFICEHPYKNRQDQEVILRGSYLLAGGVLTAVAGCSVDSFTRISDTEVRAVLDLANAALATVEWMNPGGDSTTADLVLQNEPAPVVFHTSVIHPTEGAISQDLFVYGRNLDPTNTGKSIALTGATLVSTVLWSDTFIHLKVNITGVAGSELTAVITGSVAYPSFHVETIEAAGGGAPTVTSVTFVPGPSPMEAGAGVMILDGTNLAQVDLVEVWPQIPSRAGPDYVPHSPTQPGAFVITAKSDTQITGTLTLGAALRPWSYDLVLYDSVPALLLTVSGAVAPTPYTGLPNDAPVVQNTAVFDTISEIAGGAPQLITFQMVDPVVMHPGETWGAFNATIVSAVPGAGPNDWDVTFFINAPGPYALYCYRSILLNPDRCVCVGLTGVAV